MQYRDFGKLGFKVSALGFGAMRLPENARGDVDEDAAAALIRAAVDAGVNFVDTAPAYCRGRSEAVVGAALRDGYRARVWLSTKTDCFTDRAAWRRRLDQQLHALGTDYLDVYHLWGIGWDRWSEKILPSGILKEARRAQADGLFRHLFFSFHAPAEELPRLVDTGEFAGCTVQYNLIDRRYEAGLTYAAAKGLATVVMGPVGGGRLAGPSAAFAGLGVRCASTPELALRFVLAQPSVHCALSGMSTPAMVAENVAAASRAEPLTAAEREAVAAGMEEYLRLADLYCTACGYCEPCPAEVPIGRVLQLYGLARVYGSEAAARELYAEIGRKGFWAAKANAAACNACGGCAPKCPQRLDIPAELATAHAALDA
jgi:hypothetical protein